MNHPDEREPSASERAICGASLIVAGVRERARLRAELAAQERYLDERIEALAALDGPTSSAGLAPLVSLLLYYCRRLVHPDGEPDAAPAPHS